MLQKSKEPSNGLKSKIQNKKTTKKTVNMAALAIGDGKYTHLPDFDFELSAAGLHVQFAFF